MKFSNRILGMQYSPIRKLVPLIDKAKKEGVTVYELHIGQPDVKTPDTFFEGLNNYKEKIVKFNLYELLGKNNLYRFVHNFPRRYLQNDDDYLTMDLEKLNMYDIAGHDIRSVLVSASGEKVKDISESEMEKIDRERKLYFSPKYDWDRGGISEQIDDNLAKYHLSRFKNFISPMNDEPSKINVSGSNFAKLFPEVGKNINYLNRIYFRPKQYNEREWFDNIIYWFAPEGQDVMELYATDETTGEKTQIHSYDEFVAWIKAHPKN